jgi:hypothetical protein
VKTVSDLTVFAVPSLALSCLGLTSQSSFAGVILFEPNSDSLTSTNGRVNSYNGLAGEFAGVVGPTLRNEVINGLAFHAGSLYLTVFNTVSNTNGRIIEYDLASGASSNFCKYWKWRPVFAA